MPRMTLLPVLLGTSVVLGAGYAVTVVAPSASDVTTRRTPDTPVYTVGEVRGRQVYAREGCVLCHTMEVRDTFSDAGLADRPTEPGDTAADRPALLGDVRFGPDLSCVGDRVPGVDAGADEEAKVDAMVAYLTDPPAYHEGSTMPSYRHLSGNDLRRVASFLVAQTCTGEAGE